MSRASACNMSGLFIKNNENLMIFAYFASFSWFLQILLNVSRYGSGDWLSALPRPQKIFFSKVRILNFTKHQKLLPNSYLSKRTSFPKNHEFLLILPSRGESSKNRNMVAEHRELFFNNDWIGYCRKGFRICAKRSLRPNTSKQNSSIMYIFFFGK